jgi:hypothetical protein
MVYPILGVELVYFLGLLFRRSYLSVLHRVCASIVEAVSLFALTLPLVKQFFILSVETEANLLLGLLGLISAAELATVVRLVKVYVQILSLYCREKATEEGKPNK